MKLVILDRDGVINEDFDHFIKTPDEWLPIPNSLEAIAKLNKQGYLVAVATNQSGIARGLYTLETLDAIHDKMHQALAAVDGHIDAVYYCPHIAADNCECRKPKTKMVIDIGKQFDADLNKASNVKASNFKTPNIKIPGIGDSLRDLQAFASAGCQPMLVRTGKGETTLANGNLPPNTMIFDDLAAAVQHILDDELTA